MALMGLLVFSIFWILAWDDVAIEKWGFGRCQDCGYDLTGLDHNRCPECGKTFHGSTSGDGRP